MAAATAAPAAGREQKGLLQKLLAEQTAAAKEVLRLNRELEQQLQQSSLDSTSGQASSATAAHGAVRPPPRVQPRHSPPQEYRVLSEPLLGGEAASDQIDAGTWAFVPGSKFILGGVSSVGSMVGGIGQGISGALFAGPHDEEAAAAQDAARGDEVHVRTEEDAVKAAKMNRQKSKLLVLQSIQPQSEACPTESLYRQGSFWTSLALSHTFTTTSMVAIILNSVWIAVDTDHNKADVLSDAPLLYQIVDNFFCFFFFGELFVRFMAFDRARNVFKDGWFIFDATIVACMVWETWIQVALFLLIGIKGAGGLMNASVLRIFRIFRLTRVVRMGRLIHLWPELFILASAVAQAMRSVVATILLLCIVIYIFALVFVVLLSGTPVGRASFPNVPAAAMLLLLNVICGFDKDVITGLQEHGVVCFLLFLLYFMLGQLTMMNMLIGVVCEVVSVEARHGLHALAGMAGMWKIILLALVVRLLLIPFDFYRSTDFEVHRNWLAITHSLPLSQWYYESTSQWTLDYPPAFAYFEWLLSRVAVFADADMLKVANLEYASAATVLFQRLSVVACDVVLCFGAWRAGRSSGAVGPATQASVALALLNPALLLVDHVHFQYNGMLLGLLLLSAAEIEDGNVCRGAALFCLLLNMKQIFLYVAPVFFVYLLRGYCACSFEKGLPRLRFAALCRLAAVVLGSFALYWAPLVATGQVFQAVQRLFPFGRGLTHAYWAPNVWALYNTADRVLAKLGLGSGAAAGGQSATAGFAEVYESSVLWTVPPKATFALTLLAYAPLAVLIWRQTPPGDAAASGRRRGSFVAYTGLGSAVAFALGWHVHEKAILMVTIPLLVAAASSRHQALREATWALSLVATFSVLPLMPERRPETLLKWALLLAGHLLEGKYLLSGKSRALAALGFGAASLGLLVLLGIVVLGLYRDFGGHRLLFGSRMEFLPLMLVSDFCSLLVLGGFVRLYRLLSSSRQEEAQHTD
eukprot:TRINITY_DN25566_c0_g1_i2.p1 TRINITY_DN25566_c0_g1~~TRINITY_DN25566_c0_g1_i2.p1  ORF type:complete len:979 (-),score=229.73 TRINITY_DN25566_c0_g1_i2:156-3092(-)